MSAKGFIASMFCGAVGIFTVAIKTSMNDYAAYRDGVNGKYNTGTVSCSDFGSDDKQAADMENLPAPIRGAVAVAIREGICRFEPRP